MTMGNRLLLLLLGTAHSLNHSFFLVLPPIIPLILKDTGASVQTLSLATSAGYVVYGVGALVGGTLSDRIGEKRVLILSLGLSGLSTTIIYTHPTVLGLGIGFFFIALWASLYHPTANSIISKVYVSDTAAAMGIHGAAASTGQAFTPMVAALAGLAFGWQFSFLLFGVIAIVVSVYFSGATFERSSPTKEFRYGGVLIDAFRTSEIRMLLITSLFGGLCFRGLEFILPTFLVEGRGLSIEMAALTSSLVLAFSIVGQLLGGRYADRMGGRKILILSGAGSIVGLLCLLFFSGLLEGVVAFTIIYGIFHFAHQPALSSLAAIYSREETRGVIYGVIFFMAFGIGSFSVAITGYSADNFGLDFAVIPLLVYSLITMIVPIFLPENKKWRAADRMQI